jgi:hypothetical protein
MVGAQTFRGFDEGEDEMKVSAVMRWVGPAAIVGGVFMMFSDLLNLTIYVPGLGEAAHTGYQAVGSGVILFALVLLLVGMLGFYVRSDPDGPKVLEYGDANDRYVLAEPEEPRPVKPAASREARSYGRTAPALRAARRHRTVR